MNWRAQWDALAARIDGLLRAGEFLVQTLRITSEDQYSVADQHLGRQAQDIVDELSSFLTAHRESIPPAASETILRFLEQSAPVIKDANIKELAGLKLRLTALAAMRAEVEYHLSDFEAVVSRRAERAFLHLRQMIVANDDVQRAWQSAFERGEVHCERLGGSHLMLHGLWAFKVNADGSRTDLVFGDPLADASAVAQVADALVLTEWKLVRDAGSIHTIAKQAREQMQHYAAGPLGGIELKRYRYVVLVSQCQLAGLEDVHTGAVIFRHVNIAVSPLPPSRAARQ